MYGIKKLILVLVGLLIIFMGVAPFLVSLGYMPSALSFIPVSGSSYNIVIVVLGVLVVLLTMKSY